MARVLRFSEWELGPLESFEGRWADPKFEAQSKAFLRKFVDPIAERIASPSLLCRRDLQIDGQRPSDEEIGALQEAIAFAFLDENPRSRPGNRHEAWKVITTDNAELYVWPIDIDTGHVTVTSGFMVRTRGGGYQIADDDLVIRPPLDLHFPGGPRNADETCLEALHEIVLLSLRSPGKNVSADRITTAIGWFVRAWRNTATVHSGERLVFLKTAFEALTGTSESRESARVLRRLFESISDASSGDSEQLVWSPDEQPIHPRVFGKKERQTTEYLADLESWFMKFADARNSIIHQGIVPELTYDAQNPEYAGHLVFTAEYLLRIAVKVSLAAVGFPDLWRSRDWRAMKAAFEKAVASSERTGL